MKMVFQLNQTAHRIVFGVVWVLCTGLIVLAGLRQFVTASLADPKIAVDELTLQRALSYFPASARLQLRYAARLAEAEANDEQSHEENTALALQQAMNAVQLAPHSYEALALRAVAYEAQGNLTAAETDLRRAVEFAPGLARMRWRLANLFVRAGKLDAALPEFREVLGADPSKTEEVAALLWEAGDGDVAIIQQVLPGGENLSQQFNLALFFLRQETPAARAAALSILHGLDSAFLLGKTTITQAAAGKPPAGALLDALLGAGEARTAYELWQRLHVRTALRQGDLLWNGDFESLPQPELKQFDWVFTPNRYVRAEFVADAAISGRQALQLRFLGGHTTRLAGEVKQRVYLSGEKSYQLQCSARAERLTMPATGLQLAVMVEAEKGKVTSGQLLGVSAPLPSGSYSKRVLSVSFTVPKAVELVSIQLRQTPEFSYAEPTTGTVWLDDCSLREEEAGGQRRTDAQALAATSAMLGKR